MAALVQQLGIPLAVTAPTGARVAAAIEAAPLRELANTGNCNGATSLIEVIEDDIGNLNIGGVDHAGATKHSRGKESAKK